MNAVDRIHLLSAVVLETGSEALPSLALAISHRPGRLPCTWSAPATSRSEDAPLRWQCADGVVEEVDVAHDHPHRPALWSAINSSGLLVLEIRDDQIEHERLDLQLVVGYWTLSSAGGSHWLAGQGGAQEGATRSR